MHGSGSRHLVYRLQIGLFGVKLDQAGYGSGKNMAGMAGIGLHLAYFLSSIFLHPSKVAAAEHTLQVLLEKIHPRFNSPRLLLHVCIVGQKAGSGR